MNWDQVQGKWKQYKGKAKEKWGQLTDDDLDMIDGRSQQLVGKLQERYGIAKEAAEKQANEFLGSLDTETMPREDEKRRVAGQIAAQPSTNKAKLLLVLFFFSRHPKGPFKEKSANGPPTFCFAVDAVIHEIFPPGL